jgi:hypothetical protein
VLYIPCPTHQLTLDQIRVISRFRLNRFHNDCQFNYNAIVKYIIREIVGNPRGATLEIGPSFYPLFDVPRPEDMLCDIDEEALHHLSGYGHRTVTPAGLNQLAPKSFHIAVACFVFHFELPQEQADEIGRLISDDGLVIFNVVTHSAETRTRAAALFSKAGFQFDIFNLSTRLGKEDALYIGSRGSHPTSAVDTARRAITLLEG